MIQKPWGFEEILEHNDDYVIKRLFVRAGEELSLQYHNKKRETWYVAAGTGIAIKGEEMFSIRPGSIVHLEPQTVHWVKSVSNLEIIETSTPHLDDLVRVEDKYGRE